MKFTKFVIVFLLSAAMIMIAVHTASAGCEVFPGGPDDPVTLDEVVGTEGKLKGVVAIY